MSSFEARLSQAYDLYRRGDLGGAERIGRELIAERPQDGALNGMLGMIAVQRGRFAEATPHLRVALTHAPDNIPLRIHLAFALANTGEFDEARAVASGTRIPQLERIVAYADQLQGRHAEAIARYRQVLAAFPEDAESWKNLGLLLSDHGGLGEAADAYQSSLAIVDDPATVRLLARTFAKGHRHPERQALLREAVQRHPQNAALLVELGVAEGAMQAFDQAERAYRSAIAQKPADSSAYLEYGMMLESLNRLDELEALIGEARQAGASGARIDFLEATLLKRRGRFADALALAEQVGGAINPGRRAQLIGEAADRLGDSDRAFAAFEEMNRLSAVGPAADYARGRDYPGQIARTSAMLTPERVAGWAGTRPDCDRPAPVFLLGFPRSGTTLLDTLLMNLAATEVLEEESPFTQIERETGGVEAVFALADEQAAELREQYWRLFDGLRPLADAADLVIDKFPLHMVRAPLIDRVFPDARYIFAERHPCDVVLSCFMARFQINRAMIHFTNLESAARLYDSAMASWEHARSLLGLRVHPVRYERLVEDPAAELRPVIEFIGKSWDPGLLDHQASAARRDHIATPSYSQVAEPIYSRAAGRWQRYREQLEPVLPVLAPWAERLGYEI